MNRWDEVKPRRAFWDPETNRTHEQAFSDLELIKEPSGANQVDVLYSLFNIVIELTEKVDRLEKELRRD